MSLLAVAVVKDNNNNIIGFNVVDTYKKETKIVSYKGVQNVLKSAPGCIKNLEIQNDGSVESNNGKLDRYPAFLLGARSKLIPHSNAKSLVVIGKYGDVGYFVSDSYGKIFKVTNKQAIDYASENGIANGKIKVMQDGTKIISSISGNYEVIDSPKKEVCLNTEKSSAKSEEKPKEKEKAKEKAKPKITRGGLYNRDIMTSSEENKSNKDSIDKADWEEYKTPIITKDYLYDDTAGLEIVDKQLDLNAEQKLASAASILRAIDPFLYAAYLAVDKYGNRKIKTMGVTSNKLIYSIDFVLNSSIGQISYTLLHEMLHIVMRHPAREFGRRHKLWNVACDLFINKSIYDEHGCGPKTQKVILTKTELSNGRIVEVGLEYIPGALFDENVDTEKMTVEQIYDQLEKENPTQDKQKSGKSKESDSGDESDSGNQGGEMGDGSSGGGGDSNSAESNQENGGSDNDDVNYNGKPICKKSEVEDDIYSSEEDVAKTKEEREQESISTVRKIIEKYKMMDKYGGTSNSSSLKKVENLLVEVPKYVNIIRKYMNEMSRKEKSYKKPNKRIESKDLIYKGRSRGEPKGLSDIHIAIDTSGSISTEEVTQVLNQILGLMKKFDLSGEVVLWDTVVHGTMEFKKTQDILNMREKIVGNGGTDIQCYFDYIKSSKCRKKPKLIIIYTDGYFNTQNLKPLPRGLYGPVVWIISGRNEYKSFKPGFGTIAPAISD